MNKTLSLYLREISQLPLLSREEEQKLGYRILAGDKYAVQKLVECNLRFVIKIAKKFQSPGVHLLDLINEGNVGLIEAAMRFDPNRNIRFISYAVWWVRQMIFLYLSKTTHPFRVPPKTWNIAYRVTRALAKIKDEQTETPSKESLAQQLGISWKELNKALDAIVIELSLDHPIEEATELKLAHGLQQTTFKSAEAMTLTEDLKTKIKTSFALLTPLEQKVLTLRFGLGDGNPERLHEIGLQMNRSRERIRQIEKSALNKLRKSAAPSLATYLN